MIIGFGVRTGRGEKPTNDADILAAAGCDKVILVHSPVETKFKLDEVLQYIRKGDVLVVTGLDRLGDTLDRVVRSVAKLHELDVGLRVEGCITAGTPTGDSFVSVCHLLATECERLAPAGRISVDPMVHEIRGRGRPGRMTGDQQERALRMLSEGRASVPEVAKLFSVSAATIYRLFPRRHARMARLSPSR